MSADTTQKALELEPELQLWKGPDYEKSPLKVLVLGESRYDEDYSDKRIIQEIINGNRNGTFTKFVQAVLGKHHSDPQYDSVGFWNRTMFCNYHTRFFPGGPRISPTKEICNVQNQKHLQAVLRKYKPTHCIVWGKRNWSNVEPMLQKNESHYAITLDNHKTLFCYVTHPSVPFRYQEWNKSLSEFLSCVG